MRRRLNDRALIFIGILFFITIVKPLLTGGISYLMEEFIDTLYMLPGIIIALSFHEFAHAKVADYWGDDTPARQGRLTVDPRAHIDLMGIVCLLLIHFGWGKPVMINPQRFRDRRKGLLTVSLAGVTMNFLIAVVFGGVIKLLITVNPAMFYGNGLGSIISTMLVEIIYINLSLMFFNLLPVPPLDGFNFFSELFRLYNTKFYVFVRNNSWWLLWAMIILNVPSLLLSGPLSWTANLIMHTIFHIY